MQLWRQHWVLLHLVTVEVRYCKGFPTEFTRYPFTAAWWRALPFQQRVPLVLLQPWLHCRGSSTLIIPRLCATFIDYNGQTRKYSCIHVNTRHGTLEDAYRGGAPVPLHILKMEYSLDFLSIDPTVWVSQIASDTSTDQMTPSTHTTSTHIYTLQYTGMSMHTHTHVCTHTYTHRCMHTRKHTHSCTYAHTHMEPPSHADTCCITKVAIDQMEADNILAYLMSSESHKRVYQATVVATLVSFTRWFLPPWRCLTEIDCSVFGLFMFWLLSTQNLWR